MSITEHENEINNKLNGVVSMLNKLTKQSEEVDRFQIENSKSMNNDFKTKFELLGATINPLVSQINNQLEGSKLFVLSDKNNNSFRKFYQIVLSYSNEYADVLHDPYLLIEGYPNTGQVRITKSKNLNEGNTTNVENVNDELLTSSMTEFLSSTVTIDKISE